MWIKSREACTVRNKNRNGGMLVVKLVVLTEEENKACAQNITEKIQFVIGNLYM